MTKHRRQFTKEFKLRVIREVAAGKPLAHAAANTHSIPI